MKTALSDVLAAMTDHQSRLRAVLERYEPVMLARRPSSGEWSAIENVRHLILATQHHLGPFVPGGLGMSAMGLPQGQHLDTNATTDVAAVLDEWVRVHATMCDVLDISKPDAAASATERGGQTALSDLLPRCLRHQQAHGRLALRALSEVTGQTVRMPRAPRT